MLFQWLTGIPPGHATYIAHVYLICTSKDLEPFFFEPSEVLGRFRQHIEQEDIPLRVAARIVAAIAVIDLVFACQAPGTASPIGGAVASRYENIIDLNGPLWKKTTLSWTEFSQEHFSPGHIASWLQQNKPA